MMKQEEIARRIEAVRKRKPWLEARMDRLAKLDPGVRTIGQFMLGYDEKGKHSVADGWNRRNHGIKLLKRLSEPALIGLGEALFPRDTDAFKAAWSLHEQLPYQTGYVRKPFRAPGRPDLLNEPRRSFLGNLLTSLEGIDESLPWLAAHAPYLASYYGDKDLGLLFAGAIDLGGKRGQEVEQVLRDSASGLHEIGQMGRHVTSAFLCCEKADCWEFVEKLLLAAQRQEGLRQAILESVDFARPAAFRRMLRVIDEENLIRFSATIRAADVWLGMQLDSTSARYAAETIRSIATFLDDATARDAAIRGEHPEKAFLGLWSMAFEDAPSALSEATKLLGHRDVEHRFVGVHSLGMLAIRDTYEPLLRAMDDPDPRVAVYASSLANVELKRGLQDHEEVATDQEDQYMFGYHRIIPIPRDSGDYFERLVRLFDRLPARAKEQKPLVWPWTKVTIGRQPVADAMIDALGERPASKVLPYLDVMSPYSRARVAYLLGKLPGLDAEARATLVRLVGDAAGDVRETAAKAMSKLEIAPADLDTLEPLLDRKKSDLRRSVLNLILSLKDKDALASASRLASSKSLPKRLAGLDLLCQMRDLGRAVDRIHSLAESYRETHPSLGRDEQVYLDKLTQAEAETLSLDDAVGLMIDAERTPPSMPRDRGIRLCTPAAFEILKHFDEVIHKHREESITLKAYGSTLEAQPLGAIRYGFPSPMEYDHAKRKTEIRPLDDLPLREIWWEAWEQRSRKARDPDGMEAARALIATSLMNEYRSARRAGWRAESMERLVGRLPKVRYLQVLDDILAWVAFHKAENNLADFVVDGLETILAAIPRDKLADKTKANDYYASESHSFRDHIDEFQALTGLLKNIAEHKGHWTKEHTRRMFGLLRWIDEPLSVGGSKDPAKAISRGRAAFKGVLKAIGVGEPKGPLKGTISRGRMDWESLLEAFEEGWANDHDLCDHLLGTRSKNRYGADTGFDAVRFSTSALYRRELPERSIPIVRKSMARILEIELARGESPTVVTSAALAMRYAGGLDVLVNVLLAIGRDPKLQRTYSWGEGSLSKSSVFSHLIRVTRPGKEDTPEAFARAVQAAGIAENTLLAVAFYAPQWARFVQHALGWPLFEEAVWWFHAHTKDTNWRVESDIRESWNAEIRKLTPLTLEDLTEGAVDVDWFRRTHKALGDQRWARLDEFAKYASGGAGHKRAQLFAGAILGKLDKPTLIQEIQEKRKQDAIRALGLIPIDKKGAKKDVLERYRLMQEFIRGSRQFGSQRQASEKLAARIAQENLARTAGYTDPIRLQWAMEALETADLANGPVAVQVKDVVVSLAIDPDGQPEISVKRGEKPLKSIPPDVKKAEVVEEERRIFVAGDRPSCSASPTIMPSGPRM